MWWNAFVLSFAVTAAVGDFYWRKIPRVFVTAGLLVGLAYHWYTGQFLSALLTAVLAFGIGLAFFELRAVGGGDVKLMAALGAMLGFQPWLEAMKIAVLLAGVMAIIGVVRRGLVRQTARNIADLLGHLLSRGPVPHPEINVQNPSLVRVPFGVAAAMGIVFTVFTR